MSGAELIALIRGFHRDCDGCPVEQMCDEYEALLGGNTVLLTPEQSSELGAYLCRIIAWDSGVFTAAHDVYDDAYHFLGWFPS